MHRSRIGTKRALSDIPAATILMFAVALLGVFLLTWSNQLMGAKSTDLTNAFTDSVNRITEEIQIEQVWFGTGPSGKFVNVTLSNISTIGITITEIELVNSTDTHTITLNQNLFPTGINSTYSIEEVYVWISGEAIDVTVFTARENQFKTQVSP